MQVTPLEEEPPQVPSVETAGGADVELELELVDEEVVDDVDEAPELNTISDVVVVSETEVKVLVSDTVLPPLGSQV